MSDNKELMTFLNQMKNEMREEISKNRSEIRDEIQSSIATNFQSEMQPIVSKMNAIEKKIDNNSMRISKLEREKREQNIIIHNLEENDNETWDILQQKVVNLLESALGITCKSEEFARIKRVGYNKSSGKIRPVLIRFLRYNMKIIVLKNKSKLRGSLIKIDEDYPPEVQERRRALWPELKRLREEGHVAHIRYDKIVMKDAGMRNAQKRGLSESPEGYTQNRTKRPAVDNNTSSVGTSALPQPVLTQQQLQHLQLLQPQYQHVMQQCYLSQQQAQPRQQNGPPPVTIGVGGVADVNMGEQNEDGNNSP